MPLPDVDDYTSTFGGSKLDFSPTEDPTTDESAATRNQYVADVAMMTATATRSWAQFVAAATTGGMSVTAHASNWGNAIGVIPTLSRTSAGIYVITWPASVLDALGVSHSLNYRAAHAQVRDTAAGWLAQAVPATNVVTLYVRNPAGTLTDATGLQVDVFTI